MTEMWVYTHASWYCFMVMVTMHAGFMGVTTSHIPFLLQSMQMRFTISLSGLHHNTTALTWNNLPVAMVPWELKLFTVYHTVHYSMNQCHQRWPKMLGGLCVFSRKIENNSYYVAGTLVWRTFSRKLYLSLLHCTCVSVLVHHIAGMILWIVLNYQYHTTLFADKYGTEVMVKVDMYVTQILASN